MSSRVLSYLSFTMEMKPLFFQQWNKANAHLIEKMFHLIHTLLRFVYLADNIDFKTGYYNYVYRWFYTLMVFKTLKASMN